MDRVDQYTVYFEDIDGGGTYKYDTFAEAAELAAALTFGYPGCYVAVYEPGACGNQIWSYNGKVVI